VPPGWRSPQPALAAVGAANVILARRVGRVMPVPRRLAAVLVSRAVVQGGARLAEAVTRSWWPVLVPLAAMSRTCRRTIAAAALARAATALVDASAGADGGDHARGERGERRPGRVVELAAIASLRLIDDGAYSVGVWVGCLRHRTVLPLLPRRTTSPRGVGQLPFGR
jgi:mycofactocin glycosyltransferase